MKKHLVGVLLVLGVLAATPSFASRATVTVMGTGDGGLVAPDGSLYYEDVNNIFYNPSYINDYKNWATIEKSTGTVSTSGFSRAEGGFIGSFGSWVFGAYFNRSAGTATRLVTFNNRTEMRPIELFFGADMMAKWGLSVQWAKFKNKTIGNSYGNDRALMLRFGAQYMDFEPFLHWGLIGESHQGSDSEELQNSPGSIGIKRKVDQLIAGGMRYHYGEWVPFGAIATQSNTARVKVTDNTNVYQPVRDNLKSKSTNWVVGLGRSMKASDSLKINYSLAWANQIQSIQGWVLSAQNRIETTQTSTKRSMIPLNLAGEYAALSWLTVRSGISYAIYDMTNEIDANDATTGRIGATIKFGKLDLDFAVGNTANGTVAETGTEMDTATFGFNSSFFSQASLTYYW